MLSFFGLSLSHKERFVSDFYSMLSRYYDVLFPVNTAAAAFLADRAPKGGQVLDLACGTGVCAYTLSQRGYSVTGIDLDPEMIRIAKDKYGDKIDAFIAGDMLDAGRILYCRNFDLVYSIGNSIVHLPDRMAVGRLAETAHALLADGGAFIAQIVNFDRILNYSLDSLPAIERPEHGVRLIRHYGIADDRRTVSFDTVLDAENNRYENSVRLLALTGAELEGILVSAGFGAVKMYGAYDGSPFTIDSPALVVEGVKNPGNGA